MVRMVQEKFIEYIRFEKRYSQHTIHAYQKDLSQFSEYLIEHYGTTDVKNAGHQQIRSWMVFLMENGLSERSVLRKLSTLKSFYKYLQRTQEISHNPTLVVIPPKTPVRNPAFVEEQKMQNLFEDINFDDTFSAWRDRLILEVFYNTGIRLSELIELRHENISLDSLTIKVLGKRNKERLIPFTYKLKQSIVSYLGKKEEEGYGDGGYLQYRWL